MAKLNRQFHVLLYTDDAQWGGVAQYNHSILCALASRGYQVTCVQARAENALIQRETEHGVRHAWLDYDPSFDTDRMLHRSDDAERVFRELQPSLVLFSNGMPVSHLAARRAAIRMGIPFLVVEGLAAPYLADMFRPFLAELSEQYAHARGVIAVSHDNLHWLRELFGLARDKGQVIYYGRPTRFFEPPCADVRAELRKKWGIPEDAVLCFTAGRLHPLKGYQFQIEAIRQLRQKAVWPRLFFAWAGIGQLQVPIKKALLELGVNDHVKLLGHCDNVSAWLDAANIFVLPTQAEGMPLAVMEAMAKGIPVVASAVNGIPEELGPTGRLLPSPLTNQQEIVAGLISTLELWADDATLCREVGRACRSRAQTLFREERMIEETLSVIERALLPQGDYVSPGLKVIRPDQCFPHMRLGDRHSQLWPFFRREIPHNWYVDQRWPSIGFLNRDEAHILYNNALQFHGRPALEIGCFFGWSACHLALAGVELDVIDPLLSHPKILESVRGSLQAAGVLSGVRLHAGSSPGMIEELHSRYSRSWSFMFIDGDHEGSGPLHDAQAWPRFAAPDAMILFHDLASPFVSQGFDYFRNCGWQTMIYQTMQIMGVAWRGNVRPVSHQPDPSIEWYLPQHLPQQ